MQFLAGWKVGSAIAEMPDIKTFDEYIINGSVQVLVHNSFKFMNMNTGGFENSNRNCLKQGKLFLF